MSWDEWLFGWTWKRGRSLLARSRATGHPVVSLDDLQDRLRIIAVALGGRGTVVRVAEAEGGLTARRILLPASLDLFPDPERSARLYVARTALAATAIQLGLVPRVELTPVERTLATLLVLQRARAALIDELPSAASLVPELEAALLSARQAPAPDALERVVRAFLGAPSPDDLIAPRLLAERPESAAEIIELARARAGAFARCVVPAPVALWGWIVPSAGADEASDEGKDGGLPARGTELALRVRDHVTRKKLGKDPLDENPLVHSFEKLHTLEEHSGGMKRVDGSDELEAHADALEELDLREVIRSDEEARSLLRSDAMFESGAGDLRDGATAEGIPYDEWHEAERSFRPGWCRVQVEAVSEPADRAVAERAALTLARALRARVEDVRAEFLRVVQARRPRLRQLDGPDVDYDALVERHAALSARTTPPDRLYVSRRRHAPELAVLLLLDLSLSTDGWIAGERVLDVEREAVFVVCEALEGLVPELGVAGFSSHTRRHCRFAVIKGMNEPWSRARGRVTSLEPAGYTRIGPALRHATRVLEGTAATRRLLLLVTDGKPNDYDRYEGRYGVHDVRHAVLEAASHDVHVHALAIDRDAKWSLAQMFLDHSYTLLRTPHDLAPAMGQVIARMQR